MHSLNVGVHEFVLIQLPIHLYNYSFICISSDMHSLNVLAHEISLMQLQYNSTTTPSSVSSDIHSLKVIEHEFVVMQLPNQLYNYSFIEIVRYALHECPYPRNFSNATPNQPLQLIFICGSSDMHSLNVISNEFALMQLQSTSTTTPFSVVRRLYTPGKFLHINFSIATPNPTLQLLLHLWFVGYALPECRCP